MSYIVVHRTLVGSSEGVLTWTEYRSKEESEEFHRKPNMIAWYEKVAEGITQEEAIRLCSTDEAKINITLAKLREVSKILNGVSE